MLESRGDKRRDYVEVVVLRDLEKAVNLATDFVEEEEEAFFALVNIFFLGLTDKWNDKME